MSIVGQFKQYIGNGAGSRVGQLSSPTDVVVSRQAIIFVSDSVCVCGRPAGGERAGEKETRKKTEGDCAVHCNETQRDRQKPEK